MQLSITATYWWVTTSYVPKAYVGLRTEARFGVEGSSLVLRSGALICELPMITETSN